MKPSRFVYARVVLLFVILLMVLLAAQWHPVVHANQASALRPSQKPVSVEQPLPAGKKLVSFANATSYPSGGWEALSVAAADLNGDGHPDLVVAHYCQSMNDQGICAAPGLGEVDVQLGKRDGTFQSPVGYSTAGFGASSVAVADVNGDGKPDLVVAVFCENVGQSSGCNSPAEFGEVDVLLGNGDGTFQPSIPYLTSGYFADSVAVGDVNGDGHPDLIVSNFCQTLNDVDGCGGQAGSISVLLGNGDGTFQPALSYSSDGLEASFVAIADVNGDGQPDLFVTNLCALNETCTGGASGEISVLLNKGDGSFQDPVAYNLGVFGPNGIAIGDVNGDGHPDLLVADTCQSDSNCSGSSRGGVSVLLGNGDGTFQAPVTYNSGADQAVSVALADVSGDGVPDVVVANLCKTFKNCEGRVAVMVGNGDGTFQSPAVFNSNGYGASALAVSDLNGDGRLDVVVANKCVDKSASTFCPEGASVSALLNDTAFKTKTRIASSLNPSRIGQSVTFTATISSTPAVPNGELVAFYNGATAIGTATTKNGVASLSTSFSNAGNFTIKASYAGDAFYEASSGKLKQAVTQ